MKINAPRGTNDILPPDSLKWQYIEEKARNILELYNYNLIRTPLFEYTELFQRGIGENTDIVEKEMYTFEDKSGRSLTLRPEGTASVVRAFLEHKIYGKAQPTKLYYLGPMFRYERPQSGRYRQFYQIGVEVFGSADPAVDAEVISLGVNYLRSLGLEDLEIVINSVGCPDCRNRYIDRLKKYLNQFEGQLCRDCKRRIEKNPLRVLDCKNEDCSRYMEEAPDLIDFLCEECREHFNRVREYLTSLGLEYSVDPSLVRGLDYYTNTAFEIKYSGLGAQDTIIGGGRYNGLTEEIGNRSIPGIGFAMGLERLLLTMETQGIALPDNNSVDLYITTIGVRAREKAFQYLNDLRLAGLKTEMDYLDRSVKGQMKDSDRMNARYTVILGENELDSGVATIRNMESGAEIEVKLNHLVEEMQSLVKEER